jgi:hypothetical protein
VVVVGKNAVIPAGCRVGRRCQIDVGATAADFPSADLAPGTQVVAKVGALTADGQAVGAH